MRILADSSLPLLDEFKPEFELTRYDSEKTLKQHAAYHDILVCRSTLAVNAELLSHSAIQCVATASSGSDHIDHAYTQRHGIVCFDAKGSNAHAVADYVLACIACLMHQNLFSVRRVGIIGCGEVGQRVSKRLSERGFEIMPYDPPKALSTPSFESCGLDDLYTCEALLVHANYHATGPFPSANLIDSTFLSHLKPGAIIINASRGGIINEQALLTTDKPLLYCTDVYHNEPSIQPETVAYATLCTPHIAGHSIEAKHAGVRQLVQAIHQHYHRPLPPSWRFNLPNDRAIPRDASWVEWVLARYNPWPETTILKRSTDLTQAFLTLRKKHTHRHDF